MNSSKGDEGTSSYACDHLIAHFVHADISLVEAQDAENEEINSQAAASTK